MWKTGATRGDLVRHIAALWLTIFACLFFWNVAHAATEDDFLPPEQAFRFAARQVDQKTVEVRFDVADGYYLYRERFSFAAQPADVKLGKPEMPAGKVHFDETFGKDMETYRGAVVIKVPVEQAPADGRWSLVVTSQGCADKGLCYPPMESIYKVGGSVLGNLFGDRGRRLSRRRRRRLLPQCYLHRIARRRRVQARWSTTPIGSPMHSPAAISR
jgi:thiol:disulfide interchange protein DsbD